jgi:hypothetical protein
MSLYLEQTNMKSRECLDEIDRLNQEHDKTYAQQSASPAFSPLRP